MSENAREEGEKKEEGRRKRSQTKRREGGR
jgi:hypothetical protein